MEASIQATYRSQNEADSTEKQMYWKWLRLAECQTGEAL